MTTKPANRLDPMTTVVHYEMLTAAHNLFSEKQDEAYWANVPRPTECFGKVRFEVARQVATFAVPLTGLAVAWTKGGLTGLLVAAPVAWFAGALLDKQLQNAITKKARAERVRDGGRYRTVKWLAEQMGMRIEEVTLAVVRKMAADYAAVKKVCDEELARVRGTKGARAGVATGAVAGTVAAAAVYANAQYAAAAHDVPDTDYSYMPSVNPANGLPMMGDSFIDVGGNVFGTDDM
jgi:hypothetical protein